MFHFIREIQYRSDMERIRERLKLAAAETGKKSCECCGFCCWQRPCQLLPDDVSRVAGFLGLSVGDFFSEKLVIDGDIDNIWIVPIRAHQVGYAGSVLPTDETFSAASPCIFLGDDQKCKIHEVKPYGGSFYGCWIKNIGSPDGVLWTPEQLKSTFGIAVTDSDFDDSWLDDDFDDNWEDEENR